jgi:hypothetical protein
MMTAITLNLLAEEQRVQEERARDPIKIFIAIGLTLLALVVAAGSTLSVIQGQKRAELQRLEAEWQMISPTGKQESQFQSTRALAEEIMALNHSRTLIAPQLSMVKDLIPPTVRLAQLSFTMETTTLGPGAEDVAGGKRAYPKQVERLMLRMDGKVYSSHPELELDQFLQTLRGDARFSAAVDDIQLRAISRASSDADRTGHSAASVTFVIECRYKEKPRK